MPPQPGGSCLTKPPRLAPASPASRGPQGTPISAQKAGPEWSAVNRACVARHYRAGLGLTRLDSVDIPSRTLGKKSEAGTIAPAGPTPCDSTCCRPASRAEQSRAGQWDAMDGTVIAQGNLEP